MLKPRVSVIVPAYNAASTVGRCLDALAAQDYPKALYDVTVVDDGSSDATASVIKKYPVKYLWQKNSGPATARNRGAAEAGGELILFTDSDCIPNRDWITEMVRPFVEDASVAAVKGAYRTEQAGAVARFSQLEFEERFEMLKKAPSIDMVDTYSAGFRRAVFMEMNGFDTSYPVANNEDTELSYRMSGAGCKMVFNPRAVVCHLNHPATVSRYARLKFWRGYWRMAVYRSFPGKMVQDTYTPKALKLQILTLVLMAGTLPLTFLSTVFCYAFLMEIFFLAVLMAPFVAFGFRKDAGISFIIPALLFLRAAAIGSGAVWGVVRPAKVGRD